MLLSLACTEEVQQYVSEGKPVEGKFEQLFRFESRISIVGNSASPVFSLYRPLVIDEKIYVTDYIGNRVFVYDKAGRLIQEVGGTGNGPGEFKLPYGVALDGAGNLYVNDRQNFRVQIFNSDLEFMTEVKIPGQNEMMFLRKLGEKPNIVMVGSAPSSKGTSYMQEYDIDGKLVRKFANFERYFMFASWAAAQDSMGNLYLVNKLDTEVHVFDHSGDYSRSITLSSPTMNPLETDQINRPENRAQLAAQFKLLREKPHTRAQEIYVSDSQLFVLIRLMNDSSQSEEYFLDIYDLKGGLRYYNIAVPGWLQCVTDRFYFVNISDEQKYGAVDILEYQYLPRSGLHSSADY